MASVKTSLVLQDRVTGTLKKINKALRVTLGLMRQMNSCVDLSKARMNYNGMVDTLHKFQTNQLKAGQAVDNSTRKLKAQATAWEKVKRSLVGRFALGNIVANFAMQALYGLRDMVAGAITYASDLVEVQNVVDVAYGKSAGIVDKWAKTTLNAYGINEMNSKKYAGTLASMIQSSGIAQQKAGQMAMDLTGLAGDIASFYNLPIDEAFNKLRSGISGMVIPLRKLGIDISVATMQEYAHTVGIKKKWKAMTQAEKVTLRYNYLMQRTGVIQGDFVKTQYTFANQLRLVQQNWQEYTGMLAENFLPILNLILIGTNKLIQGLKDLGKNLKPLIPVFAGITVAVIALAGIMLAGWLIPVVAGVFRTIQAFILLGVGVRTLGATMITWFSAGAGALTLVALAVAGVIALLHKFGFTYTEIFSGFIATLYAVGSIIYDWVCAPIQYLITLIEKAGIVMGALGQTKNLKQAGQVLETYGSLGKDGWQRLGVDTRKPWEKTADSWKMGQQRGTEIAQQFKLKTHFGNNGKGFGNTNGIGAPDGTKSNPVHTKLSDSDINALVDVAKINYVNKFIKMQPTLNANFGDVHQNADVDGIMNQLSGIIEEAHASSLDG